MGIIFIMWRQDITLSQRGMKDYDEKKGDVVFTSIGDDA